MKQIPKSKRQKITKVMVHNLPRGIIEFLAERAQARGHSRASSAVCRAAIIDYVSRLRAAELPEFVEYSQRPRSACVRSE